VITDTKVQLAVQQNAHDQIASSERLAVLQARQAVLIAEQGHWATRLIRPAFAFPFVVYINKLVLWDKVLGLGATDALGSDLTQIMTVIIAAYFVDTAIQRFTNR
jgi:hypothetical protein